MIDDYRALFLKKLQETARNVRMEVLSGGLGPENYKFQTGVLRGLDQLADLDEEVMKELYGEDYSEP